MESRNRSHHSSIRRKSLRLHFLLFLPLTAALLGASPNGCNGLHNVGIYSNQLQLEPASPNVQGSTYDDPILVMRDNPTLWGSLYLDSQVSSTVQNSSGAHYYSRGLWNGLAGAVKVREYKSEAQFNLAPDTAPLSLGPILPSQAFQGPGITSWQSRSGDLVHGNIYKAEVLADAGGAMIESPEPLYLKLSDQVAVVPIVLVQYKRHPESVGTLPLFQDFSEIAKAAIDFIPYHEPAHFESDFSVSDAILPNHNTQIISPKLYQLPPDEIFAQCMGRASGIVQFQVVASIELVMDKNYNVQCDGGENSIWMDSDDALERIRAISTADHPNLGKQLVDQLRPVWLSFGDFHSYGCDNSWDGKRNGNWVEIGYNAGPSTLAHELGHVVLGDTHYPKVDGEPSNLMVAGGSSVAKPPLTDEQCEEAFERASVGEKLYYQEFNYDTYRTERPVGDPPPPIVRPGLPGNPDLPNQCCMSRLTGDTVVSNFGCPARYLPVEDDACMVCAVNATNEAEIMWKNECQETDVLEDAQCQAICCSVWGPETQVTRYQCDQMGPRAHEIQCDLHEEPN